MLFHIHPQTDERDTLALQQKSLLRAFDSGQQDLAAGADNPLPGKQATGALKRPDHLPGRAGKTRRVGNIAVSRDLAARDPANSSTDPREHAVIGGC